MNSNDIIRGLIEFDGLAFGVQTAGIVGGGARLDWSCPHKYRRERLRD